MKIEKLTDDKIRIIVNQNDFKKQKMDFHQFILKNVESQNLFLEILNKAKEELNFDVDGYKLLVETFSSSDDIFIFTITKYKDNNTSDYSINQNKKNLKIKKKYNNSYSKYELLNFNNFEEFCTFCEMIFHTKINIKDICKNNSLYLFNDTYYLLLENPNFNHDQFDLFCNYISEFLIIKNFSNNFQLKLKEHGKIIIKKNAISNTIKTFIK